MQEVMSIMFPREAITSDWSFSLFIPSYWEISTVAAEDKLVPIEPITQTKDVTFAMQAIPSFPIPQLSDPQRHKMFEEVEKKT